jgi:hypothetical protein
LTDVARCPGTTRKGTPRPRTPGPSGYCPQHDPAEASARGEAGRSAQSEAQRAERAAAWLVFIAEDTATMVRVVSVGTELTKTANLEAEVAELRQLVLERVPGAASRLGTAS